MRRSSGGGEQPCQRWNDDKFAQLQGRHDDLLAGVSQIVLVGVPDLLDEAMRVQAFEHTRELRTGIGRQDAPQAAVAEAADLPLAARQGREEGEIVGAAQVEAAIPAVVQASRFRQTLDLRDAGGRVGQVGEESQIAVIGRAEDLPQGGQAIDGLLHRREFGLSGAVAMFHPAVVTKERDVVDGRLDAQDQGLLIIELEGHRSHVVLQTGPFDPRMDVIAQLILVVPGELAAQKGSDVIRLDRVDGRTDQGLVERPQVLLTVEDEVGGVLDLHQAPVVGGGKASGDWAVLGREGVEGAVQALDGEGIGQRLRPHAVAEHAERIVQRLDRDARLPQLAPQPGVAVAVEMQAEWRPRWHPQIAQAELRIKDVEVVVQALAVFVAQRGLAGRLVVPRREGGAGFHRREDVDQPRLVAACVQERTDAVFLAEGVGRANELNLQAVFAGKSLGVVPDLLAQGLGEARIVEQADAVAAQIGRHPLGVANTRQRAHDDNAVVARHDARDLRGVAVSQQGHGGTLLSAPDEVRTRSAMPQDTPFLVSALPS